MDGLSGSIKTMSMQDLVLYLASRRLSGTLHCEGGDETLTVVIAAGTAILTSSSRPRDFFSALLVERGYADREQVERAYAQANGEPIGRSLVRIGILDEARVREAVQLTIRNNLSTLMTWERGTFQFVEDDGAIKRPIVEAGVTLSSLFDQGESHTHSVDPLRANWVQLHQVLHAEPPGHAGRPQATSTALGRDFAETFRHEVGERLAERGRGKRFPKDLQRRAVEYYRSRTEQGSFLSEVARELGLPPPTLRRWVLDAPPEVSGVTSSSALALSSGPQLAVTGQVSTAPVLVGPGGLRIEGLDLKSLADLLRRLDVNP